MHPFTTSRRYPAPPADLYAAIADGERLARWWGPAGFSNRFETFDFREGGRWIFTMIGPDGREYPNEARFAELVPERKVVIEHTCAPFFTLTITLEAQAGSTLLVWEQRFADEEVAKAVEAIVVPANEQNLHRLAEELQR